MRLSPLLTDLYELTMLAGYCREGMEAKPAAFDLYFRTNPFEGGYAVFAGLEPALDALAESRFAEDELAYLAGIGLFDEPFIAFLRDFRFRGTVVAPPEGTLVFANEPLLTVTGLRVSPLIDDLPAWAPPRQPPASTGRPRAAPVRAPSGGGA